MPTPVQAFVDAAERHGGVDPTDAAAVRRFYRETLPTLPPAKILQILEELLAAEGTRGDEGTTFSYPGHAPLPPLETSPPVAPPGLARFMAWCMKGR